MITSVTVSGTNPVTAPSSAKKLVVVSDDTGDNQNVSLTGLVSGVGTAETVGMLTGTREAQSTNSFGTLDSISLSSAPTGNVTVREAGTAGVGAVYATANFAEGDVVTLGLTGYEQDYTFRFLAHVKITVAAATGITTGMYFDVTDKNGVVNRFWFNKNGGGGAPSNPGTLSSITVTTGDSSATVSLNTANAVNAVAGSPFSGSNASSPDVDITNATFGTLSISAGTTGFSVSSIHAGHATAPYQVAIESTLASTLANLAYAINDSGGIEGTNYSASTDANPFLSASASAASVTITDRIACARTLAWNNSTTSATTFILDPAGGANGALLATLTSLSTSAFNSLNFNNEDLSENTLPALLTPTSDTIFLGQRGGFTVEAEFDTGSDLGWKIQTTTDAGVTWRDAAVTPGDLTAATFTRHTVTDFTDAIRIVFTTNAHTAPCALHMKVIS